MWAVLGKKTSALIAFLFSDILPLRDMGLYQNMDLSSPPELTCVLFGGFKMGTSQPLTKTS